MSLTRGVPHAAGRTIERGRFLEVGSQQLVVGSAQARPRDAGRCRLKISERARGFNLYRVEIVGERVVLVGVLAEERQPVARFKRLGLIVESPILCAGDRAGVCAQPIAWHVGSKSWAITRPTVATLPDGTPVGPQNARRRPGGTATAVMDQALEASFPVEGNGSRGRPCALRARRGDVIAVLGAGVPIIERVEDS
jgi:hypothetical protein